jgi:serine protease Do
MMIKFTNVPDTTEAEPTPAANLLAALNDDMAHVIDGVRASLVRVNYGQGHGAGTIWHADGLIVTNAHVVGSLDAVRGGPRRGAGRYGQPAGQPSITVTLADGRAMPAKLLAMDAERDIAALSIDAHDLPTAQIGDSRKLAPGEWVFAVGHPWGVIGAASGGVVIGAGADLPEITRGKDWIVINLKVRPGNSGGPLVDAKGRLVGINTLLTGPQVGAAVPTHAITAFLKETLGSRVTEAVTPTERPAQTMMI